ncbi:MAG: amidohydrolase family protein [Gemmataceae bacterium]|nr:amidohydrolase family protein [Gemmataceae bacterium]
MRIRARHYATGQPIEILWENGLIRALGSPTHAPADHVAGWVAPALFDLQINGCDGLGFSSQELSPEAIRHVVTVCRGHGIAELCPTLVTNSFEALAHGMTVLRRTREEDPQMARAIPAIHLEGPYISPEDGPRGAHARQHVRPPDWDEFRRLQDAAGGLIRLVTLAPEHEAALTFIERLVQSGVVVALGHTNATGERIRAAVEAGARLSTHLGNGSHALLPRHDNYIWEQLAEDRLWASIICDGHHLPPAVVRCFLRVKTAARTVLTCDASPLAGLPPGAYRQWEQDFEVLPTGRVVVSGTSYLAGSGAFTDLCVGNVMRFAGVSLREAVDMASERPRQLLGLPPWRLEAGQRADLVLFDWEEGGDFRVRATLTV